MDSLKELIPDVEFFLDLFLLGNSIRSGFPEFYDFSAKTKHAAQY